MEICKIYDFLQVCKDKQYISKSLAARDMLQKKSGAVGSHPIRPGNIIAIKNQ